MADEREIEALHQTNVEFGRRFAAELKASNNPAMTLAFFQPTAKVLAQRDLAFVTANPGLSAANRQLFTEWAAVMNDIGDQSPRHTDSLLDRVERILKGAGAGAAAGAAVTFGMLLVVGLIALFVLRGGAR